ncbi:708_t:CDS:2, partial [Racocetra fulgida]
MGTFVLVPLNIYGTYRDSDNKFPDSDNPLQFLSVSYLSNMNYFESDEYQTSLHARTLLVTNVPHSMQSDQGLLKLMDSFNVNCPISQAHIARKVGKLPELLKKHEDAVRKLESVLVNYLNPDNIPEERPRHRIEGRCGPSIDSIEYYTQEIQSLESQILECRNAISDKKPLNYGFVSFNNIPDAHKVAKELRERSIIQRTQQVVTPKVVLAPLPKDIIWGNLSMSDAIRGPKTLIGHALFIALCFFWLVPITFITTFAQVKNIEYLLPFTKGLSKNKFISGILEALMSPLIMAIFFLILPSILRQLAKQQGKISKSSLDRSTLGKLIKIDEGDAHLRDIYNVIKKSNLLDEIADSMIKVSTFWINYISLRGVGAVFDLAQVASLMIKFIKRRFVKPTPRNLKEFSRPPDFDYPVICHRKFDQKIHYYTPREAYLESCKTNENKDLDHLSEKVSTRFGHPSLTAEIITPMVHSNAKDALSKVYSGRVNETKVNRRGTIKSMSMFINGNNALKIQTVEESELEVDEDAYLDEQNPGYYVNYDEPQFDSLPQNQQPSTSTGYDAYHSSST